MNKFTALGLGLQAIEGKRVIVVAPRADTIAYALDDFATLPEFQGLVSVHRSPGKWRVRSLASPGYIRFRLGGIESGDSADIVYLDGDFGGPEKATRIIDAGIMAIRGSKFGEVVRG